MTSYLVHVKSKDSAHVKQLTSGFNTDLQVDLDIAIEKTDPDNEDIHVSLSSASIPTCWYNLSSNLTNINIYVDSAPSLVVTEGWYDIYELVTLVNADATFPYTAVFNENTSKITLTNSDATQHTINFSEANSRGLAKAMGFERSDEVVASGGNTVSDGCVNMNSIHSIFLYSDMGSNNVISTETGNLVTIIEKIPVLEQPPIVQHFNPYQTAPFSTVVSGNSIRSFALALRDQSGVLIQLNEARYELSLMFEILPKPTSLPQPTRRSENVFQSEVEPLSNDLTMPPLLLPPPVIPVPGRNDVPLSVIPVPGRSDMVEEFDSQLSDALLLAASFSV